MDYVEFKNESEKIINEKFPGDYASPIEFSLRRSEYVEEKLKKLIAIAKRPDLKHLLSVHRKREVWERMLLKARENRQRMQATHQKTDAPSPIRFPTFRSTTK